ncbi:30S ribosomal protein S7 [Sulfobacillus thermosulfidooxidans]|uniref:Small ribosomal subunit protein uS7 n=2 Tax=Sulfobacillus thermosulfidooxidans TaxID=28034 RepID=A0A1W1W9E2_SULTA|nr:30S ribosomal protein S7 [Sulfobacillus thermosulfidooxidans]OLZ10957.1 30S ribosomal protein S7 [Sulfobacillus thermosulfidooxidans]OLZ14445.1 30S ribosomal protein S7 [Sulfobacillus thermosulfidooxidans]OLZ19188.1 30S ribosomal protein S7 [Sulfobacillus thermosulfidooxidans]PSR28429.1 MAG: 30S ribosomal protein S7 [Sulfobacillus thermosulfidooxidans]SMC02928.1 SSU ribosomal protein S7P [Sulfobacillus thermosulfidooxidans DSM 9293]
MPRRGAAGVREIAPDAVYNSPQVAALINKVMMSGKKSLAEHIVYRAFDIIAEKSQKDVMEVFEGAIKNVTPLLEVRPRRVGGATYQVPIEVRPQRRMSLAIRWLVQYARARHERTMEERLANEILDAYQNSGGAVKKRDETHRMAEANKAFAHYRW